MRSMPRCHDASTQWYRHKVRTRFLSDSARGRVFITYCIDWEEHVLEIQNLTGRPGPSGYTLGPGPRLGRAWASRVAENVGNLEQSRRKLKAMFEELQSSHGFNSGY